MSPRLDVKHIEQKVYREIEQDGLTELYLGIFYPFYASVCLMLYNYLGLSIRPSSKISLFIVFIPIFIFSYKFIRERFTYPRIGYVEKKIIIPPSFLYAVVFPIAFFPLLAAIALLIWRTAGFLHAILQWTPAFFGILLVFWFQDMVKKSGIKMYYLLALISVLSGLIISLFKFPNSMLGIAIYWYIMSGVFLLYGLIKLVRFIYKYPRPVKEGESVNE
ncbi:MAG: hypothetical protein ACE14V_00365 [bacterium]